HYYVLNTVTEGLYMPTNKWFRIRKTSKSKAALSPILLLFFISLSVGILLEYYFCIQPLIIGITGIASFAMLLFLFFFVHKDNNFYDYLTIIILCTVMAAIGAWIQRDYFTKHNDVSLFYCDDDNSATTTFKGYVIGEQNIGNKIVNVKVEIVSCYQQDSIITLPGTWVMVSLPINQKSKDLRFGDEIIFRGNITTSKPHNDIFRFDYDKYLHQHAIAGTMFVHNEEWQTTGNHRFPIRRLAQTIRNAIFSKYQKIGIDGEELALIASLTLGKRELISNTLRQEYSRVGAAHILAVSGMHVGIIYLIISTLLFPLRRNRKTKRLIPFIILPTIWCYAFIIGLPISAIRACAMMTLLQINELWNRGQYSLNILFFVAWLNLLFNPMALFDLSFQLSYSAVLAILIILPTVNGRISIRKKWLRWIHQCIWMSIAAQIATAPLVAYYFHTLPNVFLLSSLIVIPLAYIIIFAALLLLLLSTMNKGIKFLADLPHASTEIWVSTLQAIIWGMAVVALLITIFRFTHKRLILTLLLACASFLPSTIRAYRNLSFSESRLYITGNSVVLNIIDNNKRINRVYTTQSTALDNVIGSKWLCYHCADPEVVEIDNQSALTTVKLPNNQTIGFLNQKAWKIKNKPTCDWLVLAYDARIDTTSINEMSCRYLVTNGYLSTKKKNTLIDIAAKTRCVFLYNEDWFGKSISIH
ncbi:MAG: ComEC/Rec2 family competence protein, partial [Bacteroidales bacterium]|nr:ComEC/Rec2 family competence protein [Bacteroidales bacterium]